jgi:tRNA threonylcarbamoyladenosine modification (KEOPS) complex Cgi121 subunit
MATIYAKAYSCGAEFDAELLKRRLVAENPGALVQAAKADSARNLRFVEMLAAQTFGAEAAGTLLAKRPEIDFLLRLAGTTQISKAIQELGAKKGSPFLLVVSGRTAIRKHDIKGLELPRKELSAPELGRIERAALLSAKRA